MFEVLNPELATALDRPDLTYGDNLVVVGTSDAVGDGPVQVPAAVAGFRGPLVLLGLIVIGLGAYGYWMRGHLA